jgi:hypothetical protein
MCGVGVGGEGLEEIRKIKSGMNTGRDYEKLDEPST